MDEPKKGDCRCSSVVEHYLAKVNMRVRFPSLAPKARKPRIYWGFIFVQRNRNDIVNLENNNS